jgi:nucleoside-diphosphate-sugar epimerase
VTTIAITGVGGLLGRRLVTELERRDDVERIVGLDVRAPQGLTSSRLAFREIDVRSAELVEALQGVDVLVHLAFQMDPLRDRETMRSINLDGTRNAFEAAARAAVGRVVYLSSVSVYGAHPDNDFPLTESSALRGTPGLPYSEDTRDVEHWLWPWLEAHPDVAATILRSAFVLGAGVDNFMTKPFEMPRFPVVKGHKPPMQFVHLDDIVSAIVHAVDQRLTGAYNVCAEGWLSFDEVIAIAGSHTVEVPEEVAFGLADRTYALGLSDIPSGVVAHVMHPWVMSAEALIATGWRPRHTNRDALAEAVGDLAAYVSLGRGRVHRSTVRSVAAVVAATLGTVTVLGLRARRHRRREAAALLATTGRTDRHVP